MAEASTVKLPRGKTGIPVFTNGIVCLGLFLLFAALAAAVSGSRLASGTLLYEAGCQGCRLETLGHDLPDPRAAARQEQRNWGEGGQITGDRCVWVRSGLRWSEPLLQTHCAGQIPTPALRLSGQATAGLLAKGRPPPPDSVQHAVWKTWRQVAVHEGPSAIEGRGYCSSGLGCGIKTERDRQEEEVGGEEGASVRGLFHCCTPCPPCHPSVLGRHDPPPTGALPTCCATGL